jgi:uncharacterized membrane protein
MTGWFATTVIVWSLLLAAWAVVLLIAGKAPGWGLVLGVWVLEALLVVLLVGGLVQMGQEQRDFARAEFVGYLAGLVAIAPIALWWIRDERTRFASGVLTVVLLVIPFLVIRVQQVWAGGPL